MDSIIPRNESTTSRPIIRKIPTVVRTIFNEENSPLMRRSRRIMVMIEMKIPKYMPVHLEHTGIFKISILNVLSTLWWQSPPPRKESMSNNILKLSGF